MTEHPLAKIKAIHKNTRTTPEMDRLILDSLKKRTTMPMLLRPALGLALGVLAIALGVAWYFSSSSSSTVTPSGQGVDSPRVAGSMKPVGEPKKSLVTPLPMAKQHQVPAMGTPRISPSGPVLLAGTDPVTLPGKQGKVHLIKGVLAEIVSNSAILKRVGNDKILLLEGSARFIVSPLPKGHSFIVEAAGARIEVLGTIFTVSLTATHLKVALQEGSIRFTWPTGAATLMKPSDEVTMERHKQPRHTPAGIRKTLASLRARGKHRDAAAFIQRILPTVTSASLKRSLLFDLASIRGEYLHDFTGACSLLKRFRSHYPMSPQSPTADLLWTKYRCN